ncbi:MAG: porin family protein [Alphaproteobacteria bacterium]|nr:porin family protein [Alphaproteobacteria bacterium]
MKKILLLAGVACLVAANVSAFEFNPYVAAKAKYMLARNEIKATGVNEGKVKAHDDVWGGSVAAGTIYPVSTGNFRFEIEYTKNADAKKHLKNGPEMKVKTQAALFNVYFDLDMQSQIPVTPYAGVGLGWGRSEFSAGNLKNKEDGVALQIGAGIGYRVCEHAVLDFGYRYITYGDFDKEYRIPGSYYEKYDYKPHAHEFTLGLRYEF